MRIAAIALAVVALSGCATRPVYQPQMDASVACMSELRNTPAAAIISAKATLNGLDQPTVEMLSDSSYATDAEKGAISAYSRTRARCRELGDGYRGTVIPAAIKLRQDAVFASTTGLLARVYSGQITWGQFNSERGRAMRDAQQDIMQTAGRMEAEDQERRQRAAAAFSNSLAQQQQIQLQQQMLNQQIYQQNRPVQTNCNRFGNQVSCTTY